MQGYAIIFIAAIIVFSKLISDLFSRINLPPVLGMILIGLAIGPTGFNLLAGHGGDLEIIKLFSEIGVIILLFLAGLETDIEQMKHIGKNAFIIALAGVILPLGLGFGISYLILQDVVASIILGVILTATSVSVSVMTLMDMKKFKSVEGNIILGAAIIDDIIGIIILTVVLGFVGAGEKSILLSMGEIVIFVILAVVVGLFALPYILSFVSKLKVQKPLTAIVLAFLFIYAWTAQMVEIAAITGAYLAGLFVGMTRFKHKIEESITLIGQAIFIPIFFVFIGLQTNLRVEINWLFTSLFRVVAILSKIIGSGGAAKIVGFDWKRAMSIGSGMVPRGEVALVIATIAIAGEKKLMSESSFTAVVIMVIITAFVTPFLLKFFFKEKASTVKNKET